MDRSTVLTEDKPAQPFHATIYYAAWSAHKSFLTTVSKQINEPGPT